MKEARQAGQAVDEKQFKRIEAIIQSMTADERRRPEIIGGSRKRRIAGGSGTSAAEINQLLAQFRQMQAMMKQFSKGMPGMPGMKGLGGLGGGLPSLPGLGNGAPLPAPVATAGAAGNRQHHKQRKKKKRR
jgi:signal recognition particle subunit SRP54